MVEYNWSDLRNRAIKAFESAPDGALEARLIDVFERKPTLVATEIDQVAAMFQRGNVRSPWGLLIHRLDQAVEADARAPSITANDESERGERVAKAEKWIRNVGIHYDREDEVMDTLFVDGWGEWPSSNLRPWADDQALRDRLIGLWREGRPLGEKTEAEAEERGRQAAQQQKARWAVEAKRVRPRA